MCETFQVGGSGIKPRTRVKGTMRTISVSDVIVLNRETDGWLRPYKLEESLNGYCGLSIREVARQLYRAVIEGRVRARHGGRILGPGWLKRISEKRWHPTDDYALPADVEGLSAREDIG